MNMSTIDVGATNSAMAVWLNSVLVHFQVFTAHTCATLAANLDTMAVWFRQVSVVHIEQQMRSNTRAVQIEAQVYMWFALTLPHVKCVGFAARNKYTGLDRTVYNTKYKRKKWAQEYALTLLSDSQRCDYLKLKKRDDVADAIVMGHTLLQKLS